MIVKVQQSIISSDGKKSVLIYNKNRSIMSQMEGSQIEPVLKLLGDRLKGYFNAELNEESKIIINNEVEAQNW